MYSHQWDVVLLRRDGLRLRPCELAAPVRGLIEVTDRVDTTFRRPVRVADLINPVSRLQTRQGLITPIFEPVLLRMDEHGAMSLSGIELRSVDGRVAEHQQVWRCTPVYV